MDQETRAGVLLVVVVAVFALLFSALYWNHKYKMRIVSVSEKGLSCVEKGI